MAKKEGKADPLAAWKKAEAKRTGPRQGGSCVIDADGNIISEDQLRREDREKAEALAKRAEGGGD